MKIFGDSFSANPNGWAKYFEATNYGTNGSSEYRIYRNFKKHHVDGETTIFCHTHWSRLFLKDTNKTLLSRMLETHPFCDLLIGDSTKAENQFTELLNTIWDEEYFTDTYLLYVNEMVRTPNSIHITFFEDIKVDGVYNLNYLWKQNPGKINHMDDAGNLKVRDFILSKLPC